MSQNINDLNKNDSALLRLITRAMREGVVRTLLAGNDAQCFSTEQYQEAYDRQDNKHRPVRALLWKTNWTDGLAESHLRGMPDLVSEVSPGVWAAAASWRPATPQ